jgi:hypothetical protein
MKGKHKIKLRNIYFEKFIINIYIKINLKNLYGKLYI